MKTPTLQTNRIKIGDKTLITNKLGAWILADKNTTDKDLEEAGILITDNNIKKLVKDYKNINKNLFNGTSLHIIALNSTCNNVCTYCHAKNTKEKPMTKETAIKIIDMIFKSNSNTVTIEFQGGECLIDFEMMKFIINEAKKLNEIEKKNLNFMICTNLTLMNDEIFEFIKENKIPVSTSLDGPEQVHNQNRKFLNGQGTFNEVVKWIREIKKYDKNLVGALPTITKQSLPYWKEIVDTYVKEDINEIYIRYLNYLGAAKTNWKEIGYTAEEFLDFWKKALDYIIELNKKGTNMQERLAKSFLVKILKKQDNWNTEIMSPCGAGRAQILYNHDGEVYTCDEARTIDEDIFRLGNLKENNHSEIMGSETLFSICNASIIDHYCPTCAFNPWCATCPVINYSEQESVIPKIKQTMRCKIYFGVMKYLFEKLQDKETKEIFEKWVKFK